VAEAEGNRRGGVGIALLTHGLTERYAASSFLCRGTMKTKIEEKIVMRLLFYPQTNRVVGHIYNLSGDLKYRAAVDAHEAGSFRATVARLLAALGAKVEADRTL
jgi:hypothetical protein